MGCALERWVDGGSGKPDEVDSKGSGVMAFESAGEDADANIVFNNARPRFGVGDSVLARGEVLAPIEANRSLIEIDPGRGCKGSSDELPLRRGGVLDVACSSFVPYRIIRLVGCN